MNIFVHILSSRSTMITNLRINGKYDITISNDKIRVDGETIATKEIPFIRYNLGKYGSEEVAYIEKMQQKFTNSVPIVEFQLSKNTLSEIKEFEGSTLEDEFVKFVYVDITDQNIEDKTVGEENFNLLYEINDETLIDNIVLRDKTKTLNRADIISFKKELNEIAQPESISVCNSPFSFGEEACLTALKARRFLAEYSTKDECAIPSARHECMECCGCMKHININDNVISTKTNKSEKTKSEKNKSEKKIEKKKGIPKLNW